MPTMRRAALVGLVTLLVAVTARAQTEPPPATSPPPPPTTPAAAPAEPAPPPAAPPAPVAPLPSTLAPEPASGPPLQLTDRSAMEQAPRPEPFYRTSWFWAVVGVAFVTGFIITFAILRDKANQPPDTTFGNMHAF
ncbi:MAG TPA: hypothetical protein VIF57_12540 [Polyangia bacterium]